MNRFAFITILLLSAIFICTSCDKEKEEGQVISKSGYVLN